MQVDTVSAYAAQLLPRLRAIPPPPGAAGRALALLAGWDGEMAMDRPQPLIFNAWMQRFRDAVLRRAGVPPADAGPSEEFVAFVLSPAGAWWCGGDCTAMLSDALVAATGALAARYGDDPAAWRWGEAHRAIFAHPLVSRLPLVGSLGVLSIPVPGDGSTLDRGGTPWDGLDAVHGASFRAVYDLSSLDRSRFMMAPGQSGNLLSPHADDFLVRWRDGDTILLGPAAAAHRRDHHLNPHGDAMSYGLSMIEDDLLTRGVLTRRLLAWCVDVFLLAIVLAAFWTSGLVFGIMTLGFGLPLLGLMPLVPLAYHCLFMASGLSATPGQALMGLRVRRNDDMGRPKLRAGGGFHADLLPDAGDIGPAVAGGAVHRPPPHAARPAERTGGGTRSGVDPAGRVLEHAGWPFSHLM